LPTEPPVHAPSAVKHIAAAANRRPGWNARAAPDTRAIEGMDYPSFSIFVCAPNVARNIEF
jgi:hypothetical protein